MSTEEIMEYLVDYFQLGEKDSEYIDEDNYIDLSYNEDDLDSYYWQQGCTIGPNYRTLNLAEVVRFIKLYIV